jgi:hypothetical protein
MITVFQILYFYGGVSKNCKLIIILLFSDQFMCVITTSTNFNWSRDSSVNIVTRLQAGRPGFISRQGE